MLQIDFFEFQQLLLFINAAGITGQAAVCPHHPVARDENGNRIVADRAADRLRRHTGKPPLFCKNRRNFAIGCHGSIGYGLQYLEYCAAE